MIKCDFLIVGQGLAGTVLGFLLQKQGKSVHFIDDSHRLSASMAAAGMWNPVGFKTRGKTWEVDTFLPEALSVYHEMEAVVGESFVHKQELLRIHANDNERLAWEKAIETNDYLQSPPDSEPLLFAPFGVGIVKNAGWIDLPLLLLTFEKKWTQAGQLNQERFEEEQIQMTTGGLKYKNIEAKMLILCTGFKAKESRFFDFLPMIATKGEVLTVKSNGLSNESMLNNGKFVIPLGDNKFRTGSTYDWNRTDPSPTESGKKEILGYFRKLTSGDIDLLDHTGGIRPTVRDRRPLIGIHPEFPQIAIMNGLGTRGVLIAPSIAKNLTDHLVSGSNLHREADITRFAKH